MQGPQGTTPSISHLEKQVSDKSKELDTKFNAFTAEQQQINAEIVDARVKNDGTSYSKLGDRFNAVDSQLAHNANIINLRSNINVKEFGAKGDGTTDDTEAIQNAIDYISQLGGGDVLLGNGVFIISNTINLKSKVRLIGNNLDISVYNYNKDFNNVFNTEIKLKDDSNCNIIEFGNGVVSSSIEHIYINGNRNNQTEGKGVYFNTNETNSRVRNKVINTMINKCFDEGIHVDKNVNEIELDSVMVFWSSNKDKAGIYIQGQDCVLNKTSSGYCFGDGLKITDGGATRLHNIDIFGNNGNGIVIADTMNISFLKATINGNKKNSVIFTRTENGFMPSKVYFTNFGIWDCGEGYSEIVIENNYNNYSCVSLGFNNGYIGTQNKRVEASYLFNDKPTLKFNIGFVNCTFYSYNYAGIFNVNNIYTVVGCVDENQNIVNSYNVELKQKNNVNIATCGFDYKASESVLNPAKNFTCVNCYTQPLTVRLPLSTSMKAGQEMIIRKNDNQGNTLTVICSDGDTLMTNVNTTNEPYGVLRFITDGSGKWYNAN